MYYVVLDFFFKWCFHVRNTRIFDNCIDLKAKLLAPSWGKIAFPQTVEYNGRKDNTTILHLIFTTIRRKQNPTFIEDMVEE